MVPRPEDADDWGDPDGVWDEGDDAAAGDEEPQPSDEETDGSVFGPSPAGDEPVEPGDPGVENSVFVLLGALTALAVLFRLIGVL